MTVKTETVDLRDDADALADRGVVDAERTAALMRWAARTIDKQCLAIDGLIAAANNSLEYGHRVCCAYHVGSRQPCDCGHEVLHAAVKATEEVRQ